MFATINFYLFYVEEIFVALFIFSLLKLIVLSSLMELIWPTHFYNKRHNISHQNYKIREFSSFVLKLKNKNKVIFFLKLYWKYFIYKS